MTALSCNARPNRGVALVPADHVITVGYNDDGARHEASEFQKKNIVVSGFRRTRGKRHTRIKSAATKTTGRNLTCRPPISFLCLTRRLLGVLSVFELFWLLRRILLRTACEPTSSHTNTRGREPGHCNWRIQSAHRIIESPEETNLISVCTKVRTNNPH